VIGTRRFGMRRLIILVGSALLVLALSAPASAHLSGDTITGYLDADTGILNASIFGHATYQNNHSHPHTEMQIWIQELEGSTWVNKASKGVCCWSSTCCIFDFSTSTSCPTTLRLHKFRLQIRVKTYNSNWGVTGNVTVWRGQRDFDIDC
jgi:hypothetical protein